MSEKTLKFNLQMNTLIDNEGLSVSLAGDLTVWKAWPWQEGELIEVRLADLPCRLQPGELAKFLQKIWFSCSEGAMVFMRIPHPRHDTFLRDLGYVRGLLPETFLQLDATHAETGLHRQLGINFKLMEAQFQLDPLWQQAIDSKENTYEEVELISRQGNNVIEWMQIALQVTKSLWVPKSTVHLDAAMERQLMEQIQAHVDRGNEEAAAVVRKFLQANSENERK
jgi:hypothetical protein